MYIYTSHASLIPSFLMQRKSILIIFLQPPAILQSPVPSLQPPAGKSKRSFLYLLHNRNQWQWLTHFPHLAPSSSTSSSSSHPSMDHKIQQIVYNAHGTHTENAKLLLRYYQVRPKLISKRPTEQKWMNGVKASSMSATDHRTVERTGKRTRTPIRITPDRYEVLGCLGL